MGLFRTAKAYAKRKVKARVTEAKQGKYARERIRKKAKAEYWRAKETEEKKLARRMAKHESDVTYRKKTAPKQSFFSISSSTQPRTGTKPKGSMPSLVTAPKERSMVDTPSFEKLTKYKRF